MNNLHVLGKKTQGDDTKTNLIDDKFKLLNDPSKVPLSGSAFLKIHMDVFQSSSIGSCTLGDLADAALRNQIFMYKNNRGSGIIKESWVLEKAEKFYPDGFGMIVLVDVGHNRYKINEGHSRMQTLLYMRQIGTLKKYEKIVVPVQVVRDPDQFMEVYRSTNANHGHHIKDKLTNPDYGLGREVNNFLNIVDNIRYRDIKIVTKSHVKQIALMLYGTTIKSDDGVSFLDLMKNNGKITELSNLLPDEFELRFSHHNKAKLKDSFNFALDVMKEVITLTDLKGGASEKASISTIGQHILGSAMFFGLLAWDRYSDSGNLTTIDAKRIAKNLVDKASWTDRELSLLSSKKGMKDAMQSFYEIIRTKRKYA